MSEEIISTETVEENDKPEDEIVLEQPSTR